MASPFATQMLLMALYILASLSVGFSKQELNKTCNAQEEKALLTFKRLLVDPSNRLSSWSDEVDCCTWLGIRCNNITGRVTELNLSNPPDSPYLDFEGEISPSLLELKSLTLLNLSYNSFFQYGMPSFLSSMQSLTHLDLGFSAFIGLVPSQLGNLTNLQYLNLRYNFALYVESLSWIPRLSSLEYLDLSSIDLHKQDWFHAVNTLPSLKELHLENCQIDNLIPLKWPANFTSLQVLDLSNNNLNQGILPWLSNLSTTLVQLHLSGNILQGKIPTTISSLQNLKTLDLQGNQLSGALPDSLGQFKNLEFVDLSKNTLSGPIPSSFANLSSLRMLNLGYNQLNGTIPKKFGFFPELQGLYLGDNSLTGSVPKTLGMLSNLVTLDIGSNFFLEGPIEELHFFKLSKLKELRMSSTSLFLAMNSGWVPPFQLEYLLMSSCKVGTKFPLWLQTQRSLKVLAMYMSGISDQVPKWFWNWTWQLDFLDLSNNQIRGDLTSIFINSTTTILSSNLFKGQLPRVSANVQVLNVANNSISGPISVFLCERVNVTNNLNVLDASNNLLFGELGHCWEYWQSLVLLNLGNNNLSGEIPNSIGHLKRLSSLRLQQNGLSGNIPSTLKNCSGMKFIDIGNNQLSGLLPTWIWEMQTLMVLRLRSNQFKGNITQKMCQLSSLLVLDLANNSLSGAIPSCLNNMRAMVGEDEILYNPLQYSYGTGSNYDSYQESILLVPKGEELEYRDNNLILLRMIDLSSNKIFGSIPSEISSLHALRFLNLSRNHLSGEIPKGMGRMKLLESLDLSLNQIFGEIPQSLTDLSFLSFLNLSYNSLWGRIPTSTQLQSFDALSYIGNSQLCGPPLTKNCSTEDLEGASLAKQGDEDFKETSSFYMGMGIGFTVGFWGVCSVLFFNKTCRHAYFHFLYYLRDFIYVRVLLKAKTISTYIKNITSSGVSVQTRQ